MQQFFMKDLAELRILSRYRRYVFIPTQTNVAKLKLGPIHESYLAENTA